VTVVAAGAVAVHQLRYLIGYGGDAPGALHDQGHAYFDALLPVLALLAGLTVVGTIAGGLAGTRSTAARRSVTLTALLYAGAILVAFGTQEVLEGVIFAGHPSGLAAVAANGGFVAIPLALVFGWTALLAVRGMESFEQRLAAIVRPRRSGPARTLLPVPLDAALAPAAASSTAAARAPPLGLVRI
jgi:hypothetical protein